MAVDPKFLQDPPHQVIHDCNKEVDETLRQESLQIFDFSILTENLVECFEKGVYLSI